MKKSKIIISVVIAITMLCPSALVYAGSYSITSAPLAFTLGTQNVSGTCSGVSELTIEAHGPSFYSNPAGNPEGFDEVKRGIACSGGVFSDTVYVDPVVNAVCDSSQEGLCSYLRGQQGTLYLCDNFDTNCMSFQNFPQVISAPDAPTNVSAIGSNASAQISFTAPQSNGGSTITSYTVTSSPGSLTATGTGSSITIPGLDNHTSYTFTVHATNSIGNSSESAASNAVVPSEDSPGLYTLSLSGNDFTAAFPDSNEIHSLCEDNSNQANFYTISLISRGGGPMQPIAKSSFNNIPVPISKTTTVSNDGYWEDVNNNAITSIPGGTFARVKIECWDNNTETNLIGSANLYDSDDVVVPGTWSFPQSIPSITAATLPMVTLGANYNQALQQAGGTAPYTWSVSNGSLPPGLSLDSSAGIISGVPTSQGAYDFTVQITDANSKIAIQDLTIFVNQVPKITMLSLPISTVGQAYSQTIAVAGGTKALVWSISSGALPAGLNIDSTTGIISGTSSVPGTFSFTVKVSDADSVVASQDFSLVIGLAPVITRSSLRDGKVGKHYSQSINALGGTLPITWSIGSGNLPAGISLDPATGIISGIPTESTSTSITFVVTDQNGISSSRVLSLTINP